MEGRNVVCAEIPTGGHFIFKYHLHYSAFPQFLFSIQRHEFIKPILYTNILEAIPIFFFQIQVCRYSQPSHVLSKASRRCRFSFVEMTLKEQPWEDGMWNYCGAPLMFVACQCRSTQSHTHLLCSSLPSHSVQRKAGCCCHAGGLLPLDTNQAVINGEEMEGPFVLFCFLVWYRILGIRLHIRPDHNCLLLTGELLVFHLKSASVRFGY